jgi:hypothetical protein
MENITKNWKTTVAGIIVGGVGIALTMHYITPEVATSIITIAGALGLISAKDGNQTGVSK